MLEFPLGQRKVDEEGKARAVMRKDKCGGGGKECGAMEWDEKRS